MLMVWGYNRMLMWQVRKEKREKSVRKKGEGEGKR